MKWIKLLIKYVNNTLEFLSNIFGGATSYKAFGAWLTNNKLVKENINIVLSYCNQKDLENNIYKIYEYCLNLKIELKQENISLEINNELYFI